jgi:hypothetical protein
LAAAGFEIIVAKNREDAAAMATSMSPTTLRQLYRSFDNISISNSRPQMLC